MRFVFNATLVVALLSIGCGERGPKLVEAGGTVTYKDKPVPGASLTFVADGNFIYKLNEIVPLIEWAVFVKKENFIVFNGKIREIRDIHETKNGKQIELYPVIYY